MIVDVAHLVRITGEAGIAGFCVVAVDAVLSGNRDLRKGRATLEIACLADCISVDGAASSINDPNLVATASRAGTWVNNMGLVDSASTAGRESFVCGCAVGS